MGGIWFCRALSDALALGSEVFDNGNSRAGGEMGLPRVVLGTRLLTMEFLFDVDCA